MTDFDEGVRYGNLIAQLYINLHALQYDRRSCSNPLVYTGNLKEARKNYNEALELVKKHKYKEGKSELKNINKELTKLNRIIKKAVRSKGIESAVSL